MNSHLALLQPYPFEKLNALKSTVDAPKDLSPILLSIGEPKHPAPQFARDELIANLHTLANYPLTRGNPSLRQAITSWLSQRFSIKASLLDPDQHVLPVNGTREALFAFAQCIIDASADKPAVLMPNPFYQIYEGAALLAGADAVYLNCTAENHFLPDFSNISEQTWQRCQLLYICSPGNPTGAIIGKEELKKIIALSDKYDFVIAADECYSEIYSDEANPPIGLLEVAAEIGRTDFKNCVVFHSLSKRSNLPGLRSGFVAGDAQIIKKFLLYRTYHGCAMPLAAQAVSQKTWGDEIHVTQNRERYREKFDSVLQILKPVIDVSAPQASFYLWLKTPEDDEEFARKLFAQTNITVLPGSYLSRIANGINPGKGYVRMALVASLEECTEAAKRLRDFITQNY